MPGNSFVRLLLALVLLFASVWAQGSEDQDEDEGVPDFLNTPAPDPATAFWSADPEFSALVGKTANMTLAGRRFQPQAQGSAILQESFAYEGGIWVPERDEVWFTSEINRPPSYIRVLDLKTNLIFSPNLSQPIINAVGGYYFNGLIYFAAFGSFTAPHAIITANPFNGIVQTLVDTYEDSPFNAPDDVSFLSVGNKTSMYFTDTNFAQFFRISQEAEMDNAVYRFDFWNGKVARVVTSEQIDPPNGVCVDPTQTKVYITQTPFGAGLKGIYVFDVDPITHNLTNQRLFGTATRGLPDGIKCDDKGRVWTAEGEGIVVRNSAGKIMGGFRAETLKAGIERPTDIANFALAGDELVVLALDQIWRIRLTENVVTPARYKGLGI